MKTADASCGSRMFRERLFWDVRESGVSAEHVLPVADAAIALVRVVFGLVILGQRPLLLLEAVGAGADRELRIILGDPDLQAILDGGLPNALGRGTGVKPNDRAGGDDNLAHDQPPARDARTIA